MKANLTTRTVTTASLFSSSHQPVSFPSSSHSFIRRCKRVTEDTAGLCFQISSLRTDLRCLIVPRGRPSMSAARWLQQEYEVQMCQEYDGSNPPVFFLVSPLSPYCQSEECTSGEMSLAVLNPWLAVCTPLLCVRWHHSYNMTRSLEPVSGFHFPKCHGDGRRQSPAAGHVTQGCGGTGAVAPS